jgi:hypothetical protein
MVLPWSGAARTATTTLSATELFQFGQSDRALAVSLQLPSSRPSRFARTIVNDLGFFGIYDFEDNRRSHVE